MFIISPIIPIKYAAEAVHFFVSKGILLACEPSIIASAESAISTTGTGKNIAMIANTNPVTALESAVFLALPRWV